MRNRNTITIVVGALLLLVFLGGSKVLASPLDQAKQTAAAPTTQDSPAVPELTDIIPLSAALTGSLANLKNKLNQVEDYHAVEKTYAAIAADVEKYANRYNQLKEIDSYNIAQLYALRQAVADKKYLLENVSKPLKDQIKRIDSWKTHWLTEKKRWDSWQSSLLQEQAPEQLKLAFKKAHETIDTGLNLVMQHLEALLVLQAKSGEVAGKIKYLMLICSTRLQMCARNIYLPRLLPCSLSLIWLSLPVRYGLR